MDRAEFDQYADAYLAQHAANISVTGEAPEFFSEYKVKDALRLASLLDARPNQILDFGAGIGNSTPYLKKYFPEARLVSADVSSRSLEILQSRNPGLSSSLEITGNRLDLDDHSIDLAFTACVFHHIDHEEHAHWLSELNRVLVPGGLLVVFEHNPFNPLTQRAVNTCPFDVNAKLISAGVLQDRVARAGLSNPIIWHRIFFPHALALLRPLEKYLKWLPLGGQYCVAARGNFGVETADTYA